jgi:hypothetical protein
MRTITAPRPDELLGLWERAAAAMQAERSDVLLAACCETPILSLGSRNATLVALRGRLFGNTQPLRCNCIACGAVAEFTVDCTALEHALLPVSGSGELQRLEAGGYRIEFRLPDIADVRRAAQECRNVEEFVGDLLACCVVRCEREDGMHSAPQDLPAPIAAALSRRMEEVEPGASVSFDLTCPECAAHWTAPMDVGEVLWAELQSRAERILLEVDALARAYGWTEPEVLALSPTRRAAYLQLVGAA